MLHKTIILFILFTLSTDIISETERLNTNVSKYILLYNNIWGSIYHAIERECDDSPTKTGDGSIINIQHASELRWIAISQDMLKCEYRQKLVNENTSNLFKGKIEYGDTVWIESPHTEINGWWIVHDTKNSRYTKSIDFLQTLGDKSLYSNNTHWSGKFENIRIYKKNSQYCNEL